MANKLALTIYKHIFFSVNMSFRFQGEISKSAVTGLYVSGMFIFSLFLKELPNCFPEWMYPFTFPLAMYE